MEQQQQQQLSRDDFVALLVAQLRENEAAASAERDAAEEDAETWAAGDRRTDGSADEKREKLARKAFHELGFDFPVVSDRALDALAATLHDSRSNGKGLPRWLWLSPDVVEGVRFCLHERDASQTSQPARKALQRINADLRLGLLERIAAPETQPAERRQLLLGPNVDACDAQDTSAQRGPLPVPATTHERLVRLFGANIRALSYQPLSALSLEEWDELFVTGTLFRLLRSVLGLRGRAPGFFDETELHDAPAAAEVAGEPNARVAWVADLQAVWPQFLLVLRDRLTDRPQAMRSVLPALLEMAEVCHVHCRKVETSISHADAAAALGPHGNPVVMGVLRTLASEDALATARLQDRVMLWEALHQRVVPHATALFNDALQRPQEETAQAREQARGLLDVLTFYVRGDPRRGAFGAAPAVAALHKVGIVRTATAAWSQGRLGAGGIDDPVGAFLWACALRSPEVLSYVVLVPGFCRTLGSEVINHTHGRARRLAWAFLIASVSSDTLAKRARFDTTVDASSACPNAKQEFNDAARIGIRRLAEDDPASKTGLKCTAAVIDALDESGPMLRILHESPLCAELIAALQSVSRQLAKAPTVPPSPAQSANPQQDEPVEADGDAVSAASANENHQVENAQAKLDEEAQNYADSLVRVRLLTKRFVCKLQGATATKAD